MAYADQKMSSSRIWAIVIVILIHAVLGYAFVTGLASNFVQKVAEELTVVDVVEEPPPPPEEEPPPPPPPDQPLEPPPVVSPPPIVRSPTPPPPVFVQPRPPATYNPIPIAPPPAPPAPPAPPVTTVSKAASARGNPADWISQNDYPARAEREEREGTTAIGWEINEQGRVENCRVTSSSGSPDLDQAACSAITRRGRYQPALNAAGQPVRSRSTRRVVWQLPER